MTILHRKAKMYSLSEAEIRDISTKREQRQELGRAIREYQFTTMVDELENRGLIRNVEHVGENAYGCTLHYASWSALARKAAGVTGLPGIVQPTRAGIVWICGGGGPHGALIDNTLIDPDRPEKGSRLDAVVRARLCMARTEYKGKVPWTVGGVGKKLLLYVGPKQEYQAGAETLTDTIDQGYCICKPGYYPDAKLFDVSGYYYSFLARLGQDARHSLRAIITRSGVNFQPFTAAEGERFREVLAAVEHEKPLRNALVGVAQGSLEWRTAYTSVGAEPGKARRVPVKGRPGPFRPVALLVVRTGYELCQKEALTSGAVYAMIDSVVLTQGKPTVWPSYGLTADAKATGPAEIYSRGNYAVGPEKKLLYRLGERTTRPEPGNLILPVRYSEKWL